MKSACSARARPGSQAAVGPLFLAVALKRSADHGALLHIARVGRQGGPTSDIE